jgi:nitrile hydratase accessory protein
MAKQTHANQAVVGALEAIPVGERTPMFTEPWQAQAFAITIALHRRGVFNWDEWAAALGKQIEAAQEQGDPDTGNTYYRHWLAAIERIVLDKGLTEAATLQRYRDAWDHAAYRTAHGEAITLTPADLAST